MTHCQAGPNGTRCATCHTWDEAMHRVRMAHGELSAVKVRKNAEHDAAKSAIAKRDREIERLRTAIDALRNVLGRTIETRIDPKTGKPYHYLNEERAKALALAGEVMG